MTYPVGTIVKLKLEMLGNPEGSLGVAYAEYSDHLADILTEGVSGVHKGTSFIFANGNYDGFDEDEQKMFVEKIGFDETSSKYNFTNVIQLSNDFASGVFNVVFNQDKI